MSFELAREESLAENAARLARTRLDRVLGALAVLDDAPPSAEAVHESRRDLKKLRALLRLARASLGREVYRRENAVYRDAGQTLSTVRDAQVLRHTFDKLRGELPGNVPAETLDTMAARLSEAVPAAEGVLGPHARLPEVIALLTAARERVEAWPQPVKADDSWRAPGRGLAKVYRGGRRAMRRAAGDASSEEDFHEWRKQVKHLAYHFRLLRPLWGKPFKATGKELARLGDLLGNEHDLAVLTLTLVRDHPDQMEAVATVANHIETHRRELQHAALKLGRRIYREKARHFKKRLKGYWQAWRTDEGN